MPNGFRWQERPRPFKRLTGKYSAAEKAKLFHDTAARVYRLAA